MTLSAEQKNQVMMTMIEEIEKIRSILLETNAQELTAFAGQDQALYDRLKIDDEKVDGMQRALETVIQKDDPIGTVRYTYQHPNGLHMENRTAAFGTIMIIYESRPDVTIEAACIAFKSGNKILLKGGKESRTSNLLLVQCWHTALQKHGHATDWIRYLDLPREKTQAFLKNPDVRIDLIVPRGGEGLIRFVKQHAMCPVLVSGRGNNFLFVEKSGDLDMAKQIILNAKLDKISACNALDKVYIHSAIENHNSIIQQWIQELQSHHVDVFCNVPLQGNVSAQPWSDEAIMYEEFLDYKILMDTVDSTEEAIGKINQYSGGHSATIITQSTDVAQQFMDEVDAAAVYHNASTRFTDGGEMGLGAELAISTDKLHHRGPLGLDHLVTNKWYVYGNGQIRT